MFKLKLEDGSLVPTYFTEISDTVEDQILIVIGGKFRITGTHLILLFASSERKGYAIRNISLN